MATITIVNSFTADLAAAVHDFEDDTFKLVLSNTAPSAADATLGDITEISAGNGYTAGGATVANTRRADASGDATLRGDAVAFTASGGDIGPFRYWALYNDTATGDPLLASWDYGSAVTIPDGTSFRVRFDGAATDGAIITLDRS